MTRQDTPILSMQDLLVRVMQPKPIDVDVSQLVKGIDNYHVDVALSGAFVVTARELIESVVKKVIAGGKFLPTEVADHFRQQYEDMMSATLHRTKTDLQPAQICVLQFAVIKLLLTESRSQLANQVSMLEDALSMQQNSGSRNLLATQQRSSWLRQHHDEFLFKTNRIVLRLLQRQDTNRLRGLRDEQLHGEFHEAVHIMFNPMLCAASPDDIHVLIDSYACWSPTEFNSINQRLQDMFIERLPELKTDALKRKNRLGEARSEVFDELNGLFACQALLGPAEDQREHIREQFCWLEHPGNIRLLFDMQLRQEESESIRANQGIKAQWQYQSSIKRLQKLSTDVRKAFATEEGYRIMLAGYQLREIFTAGDGDLLDMETACRYLAGVDTRKTAAKLAQAGKPGADLQRRLDELARQNVARMKKEGDVLALRFLSDYSRYRLHLRYYQLAHRIFNRLQVITDPGKAQLSQAGGHLYQLLRLEEAAEQTAEPSIVHHTIIKADVRGSTTVTSELTRQGLNPASYFSLRFFEPINELLSVYGALKVFVEGDAVILALHEYNNAPDQWYSVSRACGMARDIIDIVRSKNANSRQTGLPPLEIGVGISYLEEKPLFLFDDDRAIMISSAIGDADRLSSCAWKLRDVLSDEIFNVEVFKLADADREQSDKGKDYLCYNLNGVLLSNDGFDKLKAEIRLQELLVNVSGAQHTMFVGKFPDVAGKERQLVVRQGVSRTWNSGEILPATDASRVFYEVLPNSKLSNQVLEMARSAVAR